MIRKPLAIGLLSATALVAVAIPAVAQKAQPALSGKVTSQAEGAMEGVIVSAKREGGTVTVSVVSDAQGEYHFPAGRLGPGKYDLTIRAVGYDLSGPANVDVSGQSPAHLDLKLGTTKDLTAQLSNAEWLLSMPGADKEKAQIGQNCVTCHTVKRIVSSTHDAAEMTRVVQRMRTHTNNASPVHPYFFPSAAATMAKEPSKGEAALGEFISTVNLSTSDTWTYPLKTLPRPKGKATQVIYTTYDLPRVDAAPHDTAMDAQGNVWYSDFQTSLFGKLDPKTGKVTEYPIPIQRPLDQGYPSGGLQIAFDADGNAYEATMGQTQLVRLDPKTGKMDIWPSPDSNVGDAHMTMVDPRFATIDGKIWVNEAGVKPGNANFQLDLKTGQWTRVEVPKGDPPAYAYGIMADSHNDVYGVSMGNDNLWKTDPNTLKTTYWPIPTRGAGGRRGHMDSQDRVWWAEFRGNGLAMFDPKTQKITEWKVPTPYMYPYDAQFDDKTYFWTGSTNTDLIERLNTDSGEFTEYLLPHETNIRHVEVQKAKDGGLSSMWVGDQHNGKLIHIEPLTP